MQEISFSKGEEFTADSITLFSVLEGNLSDIKFLDSEAERMSLLAAAEISENAGAGALPTMLLPFNSVVQFLSDIKIKVTQPPIPNTFRQATIRDIAKITNFSLKTISRVINDEAGVAETTRAKTLQAIQDLEYRRNTPAHNLRSGNNFKTIALITADLSNIFYAKIAEVVAASCAKHGYRMITASNEEDPALEREIIEDFINRGVSGIIFTPAGHDYEYLEKYLRRGTAFGAIDRPAGNKNIDVVLADNRRGTKEAIEYLINQGHSRIGALLDSPEIYTIQERRSGIFEAYENANMDFPAELLITGVHSPHDAETATRELMQLADPPTALYCGNNRALIGTLHYLNRKKITMPIVSFEPFDYVDLIPQKITIIDYSVNELAKCAAENLFQRIASPQLPVRQLTIATNVLLA